MLPRHVKFRRSKRADREIAQPQICETPLFPQAEQCPVEGLPQQIVAAPHRYSDALTEEPAFKIGPTPEHTAVRRVGPIEPEGKRDPVTKQKVDFAALERKT